MDKRTIEVRVDAGKEIKEIAGDFLQPIEILREAVANSYDANAQNVKIVAAARNDDEGRRILWLEIEDDGDGMDEAGLQRFFGLGLSTKSPTAGRRAVGFKGHGTKVYYSAREMWVATRVANGVPLVASVETARKDVMAGRLPEPVLWIGEDAEYWAKEQGFVLPTRGTLIRLVDFTADSVRLIDVFNRRSVENYLRWFTIYGSFEHVFGGNDKPTPFAIQLQATDDDKPKPVSAGHPWPKGDMIDLKELKRKDDRRPYNHFRKSFIRAGYPIEGAYRIDIAVLFEGKNGRLERDECISRQSSTRLYSEEERYGLWLCKDFVPVERRGDWIHDAELETFAHLEPKRALILVNCDSLSLTANRGSVGNSPATLLEAIRNGVLAFLQEIEDDKDLVRFREQYEEERNRRARDKDKKAFRRRIERYNSKKWLEISIPGREAPFGFYEPQREVTVFGVLCQLAVVDPDLLGLEVLDYDDYSGIDFLVQRRTDPSDLLEKDKVAYVELKYELRASLNHAFDNLHSVVCWDCGLREGDTVTDAAAQVFSVRETTTAGRTFTTLQPPPESKLTHTVRVIVLRRLLQEQRNLAVHPNPHPIEANGRRG